MCLIFETNNGLVHDIFKDLDQAKSYVHYTGLDKMICHEGLTSASGSLRRVKTAI